MGRIIGLVWGLIVLGVGASTLVWIGYNLLIERQPETEGMDPRGPAVLAMAMVSVGIWRIRTAIARRAGVESGHVVSDDEASSHPDE